MGRGAAANTTRPVRRSRGGTSVPAPSDAPKGLPCPLAAAVEGRPARGRGYGAGGERVAERIPIDGHGLAPQAATVVSFDSMQPRSSL